jgi:hypothetical protein
MPDKFAKLSLEPLTGPWDALTRPANIQQGAFRWKQNFAVSEAGRLYRRDGFSRAFFAQPSPYGNLDYRSQSRQPRQMPTAMFSYTDANRSPRLYISTSSQVASLNAASRAYATIASVEEHPNSRWSMAGLNNNVILTNNVNPVRLHATGSGTSSTIPELASLKITRARIAVEFNGFVMLMNLRQDGKSIPTRVAWCDLNDPLKWIPNPDLNLAGYQDLGYNEQILAAAKMGSGLYIYTDRSIWRCAIGQDASAVFDFRRIHHEPEARTGCIAYPNTLVSDGNNHYYAGSDGIYKLNMYSPTPLRVDWMLKSFAVMFSSEYPPYQVDASKCEWPVAAMRTNSITGRSDELWLSWPDRFSPNGNDHTIVANLSFETCDYVDHGFTCFANHNDSSICSSGGAFLGVSSTDWAVKQIGEGNYARELLILTGDITSNITHANYALAGYNSVLRGEFPKGKGQNESTIRRMALELDINAQKATNCVIALRIGNSHNAVDANQIGGALGGGTPGRCEVLWRNYERKILDCPDQYTSQQYAAANLRPDNAFDWPNWDRGKHLFFDISIEGTSGKAINGDVALASVNYEMRREPI